MNESVPPPEIAFPRALVERIVARRGRLHPTTAIAPRRTALVVLDMQRAFTEAEQPVGTVSAKAVIPAINRLAQALRAAGGHVAFSQATFSTEADGGWPAYFRRVVGPASAARILEALRPGAAGHALDPGLVVAPGDFVFPKARYSAFAPGASPLEPWLAARGVTTLIVAGTITNVCCESTARDAMQRGFEAIMAGDANAARDQQAHEATLATFIEFFGDVLTVDAIVALIAARDRGAA
jgi:nicotinamidase-related amidase